ncbi:protein ALP1-like [Aphis craccivora]|uniref:Protein ALP1-like n=1 Tax=Aphis craccivora TaxID=307492 RepID=A0A6G0VT70_APHCR|nr:protein ALP1-like [Aphis craccivora]
MNDYTVGKCVSLVVDAVWNNFYQQHPPVPDHTMLVDIATGFRERWNFSSCRGYGKQSYAGIFSASSLSTFLENCYTNLSPSSHIEGIVTDMPFVILADETNVGKAERIVKCICLLHNIIIDREGGEFSSATLQQSLNESSLQGNRSSRMYNRASQEAQTIRETFKSYCNGVIESRSRSN